MLEFRHQRNARRTATPITQQRIACVKTGPHSTAQGTLLWERDGLACVQVFSQQFIGERI